MFHSLLMLLIVWSGWKMLSCRIYPFLLDFFKELPSLMLRRKDEYHFLGANLWNLREVSGLFSFQAFIVNCV